MKQLAALGVVAALCCAGGGCTRRSAAIDMNADAATIDFRARYAHGEFAQIFTEAAPEFRTSVEQAMFVRVMAKVSTKLGSWRSATPVGRQKLPGDDGKVVFVYRSQFANGEATERFVWRSDGQRPLLVGYHLDSKALGL